MLITVYIVQSREDGSFLYPHENGDTGLCQMVDQAGHFYTVDDAIDAALREFGEGFLVFSFLLDTEA